MTAYLPTKNTSFLYALFPLLSAEGRGGGGRGGFGGGRGGFGGGRGGFGGGRGGFGGGRGGVRGGRGGGGGFRGRGGGRGGGRGRGGGGMRGGRTVIIEPHRHEGEGLMFAVYQASIYSSDCVYCTYTTSAAYELIHTVLCVTLQECS